MARGQTFLSHLLGDSSMPGMQYELSKCLFNEWRTKWNVVQIEKLVFNCQSTLYGKDKVSKYDTFKGRNYKRCSTGEQTWMLPEEYWIPKLEVLESTEEAPLCCCMAQLRADSGPCLQQSWPLELQPWFPWGNPVDTLSHGQNVDVTGNLGQDYSHFQRNVDIKKWSVPRFHKNFPKCLFLFFDLIITWRRGRNGIRKLKPESFGTTAKWKKRVLTTHFLNHNANKKYLLDSNTFYF